MAPGIRVFTVKAELDNQDVLRRFVEIQSAKELAFAPVPLQFNTAQLQPLIADLSSLQTNFGSVATVDITKPVDEMRTELRALNEDIQRTETELLNMQFKGGGASRHTQEFANTINEYFDKLEKEFGTELANVARSRGKIGNIGQVRAEFVNDTRPPDEFTTSAYKQLEEKQRFTNAERQRMIELETQVYEKRLQAIQIEQAVLDKEYAEVVSATQAIEGASGAAGANELLDSAWREFQQQSERLVNEELDLSRTLADRKRRLAELLQAEEAKVSQSTLPNASQQTARATAITVTEKSAANAERLAKALEDAAQAEARLAETTAKYNQINNGATLETERKRLELQRQNAVIQQQLVEIEASSGAERRAQLQTQAAAEIAAQQQLTQAARAATNERTASARAEANERTELARQSTFALNEQERRTTAAFVEEERRKTAALRTELNQRVSAERANLLSVSSLAQNADNLLNLATGGFAAYGAVQAIQATVRAAKEGAGQLRFAEVFEQQAQRVGVSSNQMLRAIQTASNGTVRESQAMALGAQLLSQKFAESTDNIVGDTQTLIAFSRRASQLYTDESGNLLSTQDVFARLLKYVREGNKELVDQFGISNQAIAEFLNIPVQGLAGSNGAADRFRGLVGLLTQEIERLGEAGNTAADKMESSEARISAAQDRIKQSLAPGVASVLEGVADGVTNATVGTGLGTLSDDIALVAGRVDFLKERIDLLKQGKGFILRDALGGNAGRNSAIADTEKELKSIETLQKLLNQVGSNPALDEFKDRLRDAAQELANTGSISQSTAASLEIINRISVSYARALTFVSAETLKTNTTAQALTKELENLDAEIDNGTIGLNQYERSVASVEQKLRSLGDASKAAADGGPSGALINLENQAQLEELQIERNKENRERIKDVRQELLNEAQQQANDLMAAGKSEAEALAFLAQEKAKIAVFFANLSSDLTPEELSIKVTKFKVDEFSVDTDSIAKAKESLQKDLQSGVENLVAQGLDPAEAKAFIDRYGKVLADAIASIPEGIDDSALGIKFAQINANLESELATLGDSLTLADIDPQAAIDRIVGAIDDLDSAASDSIPGIGKIRDDLNGLFADILQNGQVTQEQAAQIDQLTAAAAAAGSETRFYASAVSQLGFEFFNSNEQAGNLISRLTGLDAAYQTGQITSGQYAGQLSVLLKALYDVALNAGVAKETLDSMFGSANAFIASNQSQPDFAQGQGQGQLVTQFEAIFAAQQRREQERRDAERETTRLQQEAARAMKEAAQQQKADVSSTPGLFGVSSVTADQMAAAQAGIPQQFADDFLRQLADLIENGVQRPGVTIERAKGALENVGVQTAGLNDKAIFELLKQKWADSSLFANPENLGLINFDAVAAQMALKEQARTGVDNIYQAVYDQFGIAIDTGVGAISSAMPTVKPPTPSAATETAATTSRAATQPVGVTFDQQAIDDAIAQLKQAAVVQVELQTAPGAAETFNASLNAALFGEATIALRTQPGEVEAFIKSLEASLFVTATVQPEQAAQVLGQPFAQPQPQALGQLFDQLQGIAPSADVLKQFSDIGADGARAIEQSFATYDFGRLAGYPVAAMEIALLDPNIADRIGALGVRTADLFVDAAESRVGEANVFGRLVSAIEARVTNNVLNTLVG